MNRGDVILVRFPHPSGARGKKRPAVVVQSNSYAGKVSTIVVAEITTNLALASDPACLFIAVGSIDGKATGLISDSVVSCLLLATVNPKFVAQVLGALSPGMMQQLDTCLRAALALS